VSAPASAPRSTSGLTRPMIDLDHLRYIAKSSAFRRSVQLANGIVDGCHMEFYYQRLFMITLRSQIKNDK